MTGDFTTLPDLACRSLGGGVVATNDELFAAADNLVNDDPPSFEPHTFGPKGQVYDGWETRRRRTPGHDFAVVRLGAPGVVRGVVVDTTHFTGNYPPYASVEGCGVAGYPAPEELAGVDWVTLVPRSSLRGDARNPFPVEVEQRLTHVRLSIYPDGGVARLRVHGEVVPDPRLLAAGPVDLAAMEHGGQVVGCSNMFYGSPQNLLRPGLARSMGEGWETARRRDEGNDWVVVRLAVPGRVSLVELDLSHFKGNAPGWAQLRVLDTRAGAPADLAGSPAWVSLLPRTRLQPDTRHRFRIADAPTATHVRLDAYPDGGAARLRLHGVPAEPDRLLLRWFNLLPPAQARAVLAADGGLDATAADRLVAARPIDDVAALPAQIRD
ncbi:MAG TPA: allantoicase [Micromonosporaceae bacterium]|nr:allantoicase [Micromonosporaceae bacterium]